jgi:CRP-like cAMP-binding protein
VNLDSFLHVNRQFTDFAPADLDALKQRLVVARYEDGHVFMREGERGNAVYLLLEGQVLVTRTLAPSAGEQLICMMGPGDLFGLIALIDDGPRCATCKAVGEVSAARLAADEFRRLFADDAPLAHRFQYLIARQLANDLRLHNAALADAAGAPSDPARAFSILGDASYEFRYPRGGRAPNQNR